MIYSLHRFGFSYDEFFYKGIYKLNAQGASEFISDKIRYEYYCKLNKPEAMKSLRDKDIAYSIFKQYFKRTCLPVNQESDFVSFREFVNLNHQFVYKPKSGDSGKGVRVIDANECTIDSLFHDLLKDGPFMAEEIINQSAEMSKLHPESVNTLRMTTLLINNKVHVFYPIVRIGRGKSFVDNASSGGLIASVDIKSGVVISDGVELGLNRFVVHPDNGVVLHGYQIPEWNNAISIVKELALLFPDAKYVGWDLAHSTKGWCLVEANGCALPGFEITLQKGLRKEIESIIYGK